MYDNAHIRNTVSNIFFSETNLGSMTKGINSKSKPIQLDERKGVPYLLRGDSKIKLTLITSHLVYSAYLLATYLQKLYRKDSFIPWSTAHNSR